MPTALPSLRQPPILFAHRGARAHAPENTLEAFRLALRLGASGLESDVRLTADGVAVLAHDATVGGPWRRRRIATLDRSKLPSHVPALADLYAACGSRFELSLDVKDPAAVPAAVAVARAAGADASSRLWLCHPDWNQVARWRQPFPEIRLVDSTRARRVDEGLERRAAALASAGIDAVNLRHDDWTGGHTTLFHRFGVLAFGWDAQFDRVLDDLLAKGIDGVYSDHVDRMVQSATRLRM